MRRIAKSVAKILSKSVKLGAKCCHLWLATAEGNSGVKRGEKAGKVLELASPHVKPPLMLNVEDVPGTIKAVKVNAKWN